MIQSILIIDEDATSIFLSKTILRMAAPHIKVNACESMFNLEYLMNCYRQDNIFPDLVLAGFNMPLEYEKDYLATLAELSQYSEIVGISVLFSEKEIEMLGEVGIKKFMVRPLNVGKIKQIMM